MFRTCVLLVLVLGATAQASVTVTGNVKTLAGQAPGTGIKVQLTLQGCDSKDATVEGSYLGLDRTPSTTADPTTGAFTFATLAGNDEIKCNGQLNVTHWTVSIIKSGTTTPSWSANYIINAADGPANLNTKAKMATAPLPAVLDYAVRNQANTFTQSNDFTTATITRPFRWLAFASFPATCTANKDMLVRSDALTAGQALYICNAAGNGWNLVGDGGGGLGPGTAGTLAKFTGTGNTIGDSTFTEAGLTSTLAAKAADADVVHKTGNETIAGTKTFTSPIAGNITGNAATATWAATATGATQLTGDPADCADPVLGYAYGINEFGDLACVSFPFSFKGQLLVSDLSGDTLILTALARNVTTTKLFLSQVGDGSTANLPSWAQPAFSDMAGVVTDPQVPNNITVDLAGTATALAANPTDCSAGQYATTIDAGGNLGCAQVAYAQVSGTPSLAAIATSGSASDLTAGTVPDARFPATLPAASGANLTNLNASNLASGTVPVARIQEVLSVADLTDFASKSGTGTAAIGATMTSLATDDVLKWSGTNWVNATAAPKATALAANPNDCAAGSAPRGVDASGVAENCADFMEEPGASGIVARTAANTSSARTITGTANEITVTNGDGVSGNPTLSIAAAFDISGKTSTKPAKMGTAAPGTCGLGEVFFDTDAPAGQNLYGCTATNTWTLLGDGGGGSGTINSGVTNVIPKYTASTTLDDSLLTDDGTTLGYTGSGGIAVGSSTTVEMSATNGVLRFLGAHTGNDEDLKIDLDGTANTAVVTSTTGVTKVDFQSIDLQVPTEAYSATNWNGINTVPTKDAVRDQFEAEPAATRTLTNKTLDAEGTGNVITTVQKVWFQAAGGTVAAPTLLAEATTNAPTATCSAGATETTLIRCVADFPDSDGDKDLQWTFPLPEDWTGNIDLKFRWRSAATSGDAVWQATLVCRADAEVDDAAFNAANTVTDTAKGTANQINEASITAMTTTGCAAGELAHLKVFRNRTHASDTIAGTISLMGVQMTMRRAQ